MHHHKKGILLLVMLNIVFALVFFLTYLDQKSGTSFIEIGFPASQMNWLTMLLSFFSMLFVTYNIIKKEHITQLRLHH
ncbi:MAG: hypothetical protein V1743_05330 [Nanoarchaeota archaeon]